MTAFRYFYARLKILGFIVGSAFQEKLSLNRWEVILTSLIKFFLY